MNADKPDASDTPAAKETWSERAYREWERFWFRPADPTLLGLIRIGCGLVALYAMIACAFDLQNFVGPDGWLDLETRLATVRDEPVVRNALRGTESPLAPPATDQQKRYIALYMSEFKELPPGPYPQNDEEMAYCMQFRRMYGYDLRRFGLPPPSGNEVQKDAQRQFLEDFADKMNRPELRGLSVYFNQPPAPPYPATVAEGRERIAYAATHGLDPCRLLARGQPVWSLFFHMTDPLEITLLHALVLAVTFLYTVGFCTRLTSALTWFFYLNYVHRMPAMLFGVDVMTNIVLLYTMIGPSGAAMSIDRLIARWWNGRLKTSPTTAEPAPSIGANVAIRLLQVHLCIIYFVSGIAKLTGRSWWNGTAVWGTLANYEMAPMQYDFYNVLLRFLSHNELVFSMVLMAGSYFTLAFEIGYPFLIWRPRFRRLYLASAVLLHGMIGTVMGLSSFALIMLVMNMAFLTDEEARWLAELPGRMSRFRLSAKPQAASLP